MSSFFDIEYGYTPNPGYLDLIAGVLKNVRWHYGKDKWQNYSVPFDFFNDMKDNFDFPFDDFCPIVYASVIFTIVRYGFENFVCKRLVSYLNFDQKLDEKKFSESFWKFIMYSIFWSYTVYLLVFTGKYNYFDQPYSMWDDWKFGMEIPFDIKLLYFVECGFYIHSIYTCLFMDTKRKDFKILILHHLVTIALITLSFAYRYHRFGLMVLFCHDVNDILLEYSKCNVYLKKRNGQHHKIHDVISECGFISFVFSWCLFRLYWFPLKVIYTTAVTCAHTAYLMGAKLYLVFNVLLGILLILNFYWFYLIILVAIRIITQGSDSPDVREDQENKKDN